MDAASLACVLKNSHSQWSEDKALLPALLQAAGGRPGTFVELGALDGVTYSNSEPYRLQSRNLRLVRPRLLSPFLTDAHRSCHNIIAPQRSHWSAVTTGRAS